MFTLQNHEAALVSSPITLAELWLTLKPLKDTTPGPDGISYAYLKKLWDIIGPLILNAWQCSVEENEMSPSYLKSYLRLIPKVNKDCRHLKNWRPITLSNCDLKIITKTYNNRLISILSNYITTAQTAYVKNRNISDNIRVINCAIQLANVEMQVNGTVVALDAQKAFDSLSHQYLHNVLEKVGLTTFIPILKLLYTDLSNEVLLNGEIIGSHKITNGVKQGDALSCTLFILAIEPLLRNIEHNSNIKSISSTELQYNWPKVLGYADDITCMTLNEIGCKQAIFDEYERFSKVSGLMLNAEKTEIYNFKGQFRNNIDLLVADSIKYYGKEYLIKPVKEIRVNGVILCKNRHDMKRANCVNLIERMERHFKQWSKRNLTLLGRIQIFKTFGLSQYLYHLAVLEPTPEDWKNIKSKVAKFLWNKHYSNNRAPARIKKEVLLLPIDQGGFGMIEIQEVVAALRLRRHFYLLKNDVHPISGLLKKLVEGTGYLGGKPVIHIDEVLEKNMLCLSQKRKTDFNAPEWQLESDLILQAKLLETNIKDLIRPRKRASREAAQLNRLRVMTLGGLADQSAAIRKLAKIADKNLEKGITVIGRLYQDGRRPNVNHEGKLYIGNSRWIDDTLVTSKQLREILFGHRKCSPKITIMDEQEKFRYFKNISKIVSTVNKSKMLRLLHGDVYCGERLFRFGLTDTNLCKRCFQVETIHHLLMECPYTQSVYSLLGIQGYDVNEILGVDLTPAALEIRADILGFLLFRQRSLPPEILISSTYDRYAKGLVDKIAVKRVAELALFARV